MGRSWMRLSGWDGCISTRNDLMEMSRAAVAPSKGWTGWYNVGLRDLLSSSSGLNQPLSHKKVALPPLNGITGIRAGCLSYCVLNVLLLYAYSAKKKRDVEGQNGPLEDEMVYSTGMFLTFEIKWISCIKKGGGRKWGRGMSFYSNKLYTVLSEM